MTLILHMYTVANKSGSASIPEIQETFLFTSLIWFPLLYVSCWVSVGLEHMKFNSEGWAPLTTALYLYLNVFILSFWGLSKPIGMDKIPLNIRSISHNNVCGHRTVISLLDLIRKGESEEKNIRIIHWQRHTTPQCHTHSFCTLSSQESWALITVNQKIY